MVIASSLVPGLGLLGRLVEYITTDDPHSTAGKRFIAEFFIANLPGGFLTNLTTSLATDVLLGKETSRAVDEITPHNEIAAPCSKCQRFTNYFFRKDGSLVCSNCLASDVSKTVRHNDKIYVLRNGVYQLHSELKTANKLYASKLNPSTLQGNQMRRRNPVRKETSIMAQVTRYINCPHCGRIVEVVCPDDNREPRKVTADKEFYLSWSNTDNNVACPNCEQRIYLHWYYCE